MSRFRALIIDDEEELVTALVERLGYRGVDAEYALNGPDAIRKMIDTVFDVIVLDLMIPGMGGVEILKEIKKNHPEVPVLMITGHGTNADSEKDKMDNTVEYLPKPIDIDILIKKMDEAIKHHE